MAMNLTYIIEELQYITDCLRSYKKLTVLPTCNDCGKLKKCKYKPGWGEEVRINCPFWENENE